MNTLVEKETLRWREIAGIALTAIQKAKKDNFLKKEDVGFLKGLPSMIIQNGLGQTLAFMNTKKDKTKPDIHGIVLNSFAMLFLKKENISELFPAIIGVSVEEYVQMQSDGIELAGWLKKFSVGFLEEKEK